MFQIVLERSTHAGMNIRQKEEIAILTRVIKKVWPAPFLRQSEILTPTVPYK